MPEWVVLGRRLGPFMPRLSADVSALADKMRQALLTREDMPKLRSVPWNNSGEQDELGVTVFDMLVRTLRELPDEGYKLFPWVVREFKKGHDGINWQNIRHARDIMNQAIHWMVWSYEHNKPLPDYMNKAFTFEQMQAWVYEMNARGVDTSDGVQWQDSHTVFKFDDGWRIDQVGAIDLPQEGELMGHCVGGQGYQNSVNQGNSTIFSLRDPKGGPHVTMEMYGDRGYDVTKGYGEVEHHDRDMTIEQEYGKEDSTPKDEYQQRMDEWYDHLRDQGWEVAYGDNIEDAEDRQVMDDTNIYPPTHEGIEDFYTTMQDSPYQFEDDEDPQYEQERGHWVRTERVPDYIGHPTATFTHEEAEFPQRARAEHLYPALDQTLQGLWNGTVTADAAQWYAQAYIAAVHHTVMGHTADSMERSVGDLVQHASQWVAQKQQAAPAQKAQQPTLFEPNDYFTQRQIPAPVKVFMHYLTAYHFAGKEPVNRGNPDSIYDRRHWPIMPGEGSWPVTNFGATPATMNAYRHQNQNYFDMLEESVPQYFNKDWLDQLTGPTENQLVSKLLKMAGYAPNK